MKKELEEDDEVDGYSGKLIPIEKVFPQAIWMNFSLSGITTSVGVLAISCVLFPNSPI